jgi:predicted RNA-binding protein YlxR (DUF448 family)
MWVCKNRDDNAYAIGKSAADRSQANENQRPEVAEAWGQNLSTQNAKYF